MNDPYVRRILDYYGTFADSTYGIVDSQYQVTDKQWNQDHEVYFYYHQVWEHGTIAKTGLDTFQVKPGDTVYPTDNLEIKANDNQYTVRYTNVLDYKLVNLVGKTWGVIESLSQDGKLFPATSDILSHYYELHPVFKTVYEWEELTMKHNIDKDLGTGNPAIVLSFLERVDPKYPFTNHQQILRDCLAAEIGFYTSDFAPGDVFTKSDVKVWVRENIGSKKPMDDLLYEASGGINTGGNGWDAVQNIKEYFNDIEDLHMESYIESFRKSFPQKQIIYNYEPLLGGF
jgi:hypothetical protein